MFGVVSVRDTGPGIPDHLLEKVFDPFFTTKPVGKGTGLGLSQVYGIARESGGIARLENRADAGASVEIWLPLVPEVAATAADDEHETAPPRTLANHDILVVEDDAGVREFLVESLQGAGLRVTQAINGVDALVELKRKRPDLLLVDFLMPGMNGVEMVEEARKILSRPARPARNGLRRHECRRESHPRQPRAPQTVPERRPVGRGVRRDRRGHRGLGYRGSAPIRGRWRRGVPARSRGCLRRACD